MMTQRVIMQDRSRRVAAAWLQAGILEPPPAMVAAITEWVLAVQAAKGMATTNDQLTAARNHRGEARKRFQKLEDALVAWESQPDNWNAYKAAYDEMWILGHPGTRWSSKDFQKMTPEKRVELNLRAQRKIEGFRDRIESDLSYGESKIPGIRAQQARLQGFLKPGVSDPSQGEIGKKFDVDLTGWKYGEHLKEKVDEHATELFRGEDGDQMRARDPDLFQKMLDSVSRYWDTIQVTLAEKPVKKEAAFWRDSQRLLRIVLPTGAAPYQLRDLEQTIKHELRHFAQGYLGFAVGYLQERFLGFDLDENDHLVRLDRRLPSPGLPSRHIMTPDVYQDQDTPGSLMQQLRERLKRSNTPSHIQQAILKNPKIDLHALDDVEFYTRLADAIQEFEDTVQRAPPMNQGSKMDMFKLFVGAIPNPIPAAGNMDSEWMESRGGYDTVKWFKPHSFFTTLLRYARGKWQKAVGEMARVVV